MWWFKLYTLPQVIRFSLIVSGLVLLDGTLTNVLPRFSVFSFFAFNFVLLPYIAFNTDRFSKNLEFHKMHVPLRVLKRNYLLHKIIFHGSNVLGLLILGYCSFHYGVLKSNDFVNLIPPVTTLVLIFMLFVGFTFSSFSNKRKMSKNNRAQSPDDFSISMKTAFVFMLSLPGCLYYFFGVPPMTLVLTSATVLLTSLMLIHFDQEFHTFRFNKSISVIFKNVFLSHVFVFALFQVLGHFGKAEIYDQNLHPEKRATSYRLWNQSIPELDIMTFMEIEKGRIINDSSIYYKVSPDIVKIPISHFIEEKSNDRLEMYLKNVNPTFQNQQFLVDHMMKNEKEWKLKTTTPKIKELLSKHWPKDKVMPDVLKVPKREVASKKKSLF